MHLYLLILYLYSQRDPVISFALVSKKHMNNLLLLLMEKNNYPWTCISRATHCSKNSFCDFYFPDLLKYLILAFFFNCVKKAQVSLNVQGMRLFYFFMSYSFCYVFLKKHFFFFFYSIKWSVFWKRTFTKLVFQFSRGAALIISNCQQHPLKWNGFYYFILFAN